MPGFVTATSPIYSCLGYAHLGSWSYLVFADSSLLLHRFQKTSDHYGGWVGVVIPILASLVLAVRSRHNMAYIRLSMLYRKASIIRGSLNPLSSIGSLQRTKSPTYQIGPQRMKAMTKSRIYQKRMKTLLNSIRSPQL